MLASDWLHYYRYNIIIPVVVKGSKMAASRFVKMTDDEIKNFVVTAVPKNTKTATKYGSKVFNVRFIFTCKTQQKQRFVSFVFKFPAARRWDTFT